MNKSDQWLRVKHILGQASVVLEELSMVLPKSGANQKTQTNINNAKQSISAGMKDEATIQGAAELIEYDDLIKKLRAKDIEFTPDDLKRAREL